MAGIEELEVETDDVLELSAGRGGEVGANRYGVSVDIPMMSKVPSPCKNALNALRERMRRPSLGALYLIGRERDIWSQGVDLILIGDVSRTDNLANWTSDAVIPVLYKVLPKQRVSPRSTI
jgi:hypothetical protein